MATIIKSTNLDGGKTLYNYVGNSEETKPEAANIGENSTFTELDTGNQFYRRGNTWATMKAPGGGSGGGGSLPANFPAEGVANANLYIGFDEDGDYTAKEGGGGSLPANFPEEDIANAGALIGFDADGDYEVKPYPQMSQYDPLIVTMSLDDPTTPTKLVSNRTFGEIHTAAVGGITVIVVLPGSSSATTILDCSRDELTGDITIYFLSSGTVANATGDAEDYIEFPI